MKNSINWLLVIAAGLLFGGETLAFEVVDAHSRLLLSLGLVLIALGGVLFGASIVLRATQRSFSKMADRLEEIGQPGARTDEKISAEEELPPAPATRFQPADFGLAADVTFTVRRGDMISPKKATWEDMIDFLDASDIDVCRDSGMVSAVISGLPFEIDGASMYFIADLPAITKYRKLEDGVWHSIFLDPKGDACLINDAAALNVWFARQEEERKILLARGEKVANWATPDLSQYRDVDDHVAEAILANTNTAVKLRLKP